MNEVLVVNADGKLASTFEEFPIKQLQEAYSCPHAFTEVYFRTECGIIYRITVREEEFPFDYYLYSSNSNAEKGHEVERYALKAHEVDSMILSLGNRINYGGCQITAKITQILAVKALPNPSAERLRHLTSGRTDSLRSEYNKTKNATSSYSSLDKSS